MTEKTKFDQIVEKAREAGTLNEEVALQIIVDRLKNSKGYYTWVAMGDGPEAAWQQRIPRTDLPDEVWLKEEQSEFIHICNALKYLKAVENNDKDAASKVSRAIRDDNNSLTETEEFKCKGCGAPVPQKMAEKVKMFISLHKLGT